MVAGLPSPAPVGPVPGSASRIPVTGRQKSQKYFDSQAAKPASAIDTFTSANRRASWIGLVLVLLISVAIWL